MKSPVNPLSAPSPAVPLMPRVIHFEIPTSNPERTIEFYSKLFGWTFTKWDGPMPYWLIKTGEPGSPGIDGGMFLPQGPVGSVNTIDVPDIDDHVARIINAGGESVVPKMAIHGVGWLAYCKDPDGTLFGLHQYDPSAQ
jgi:predicted enzyme related to lactoylglutathione lyase